MPDEFFSIEDVRSLAGPDGLTIAHARALADAVIRHEDFDLLECLAREEAGGVAAEFLVVDARCDAVPSNNPHGIGYPERLVLGVASNPKQLVGLRDARCQRRSSVDGGCQTDDSAEDARGAVLPYPAVTSTPSNSHIALVLSGGGVRAMVFHLGVLRHLAEHGALEQVHRLSTVSGGSLLVGLILQSAGMRWPGSAEFLSATYPTLRDKLCGSSLQWAAARQLLNPWNWRFALSRANLLALALRKHWGVEARLTDLPSMPEWSINGTTAETGRRFRFKPDSIGDYQLGYAHPGKLPLASALAVSAAFPGGFGPLTIAASRFVWKKRPSWDSDPESAQPVDIGFHRLHLYDGGVYDNLGLEPYFDAGHSVPKHKDLFILVSDAGAPLPTGFSHGTMNPWRLKRVADIMFEQARALRVRTFMSYLQRTPRAGGYVYIGAPSAADGSTVNRQHPAFFPTTLRRLSFAEFDRLADHGYETAKAVANESAVRSEAVRPKVAESS